MSATEKGASHRRFIQAYFRAAGCPVDGEHPRSRHNRRVDIYGFADIIVMRVLDTLYIQVTDPTNAARHKRVIEAFFKRHSLINMSSHVVEIWTYRRTKDKANYYRRERLLRAGEKLEWGREEKDLYFYEMSEVINKTQEGKK